MPPRHLPPPQDRNLDGINLFALLSIISCAYCIPLALVMESSKWSVAWDAAVASLGQTEFLKLLALSGIFYHLYNQVCSRPEERGGGGGGGGLSGGWRRFTLLCVVSE